MSHSSRLNIERPACVCKEYIMCSSLNQIVEKAEGKLIRYLIMFKCALIHSEKIQYKMRMSAPSPLEVFFLLIQTSVRLKNNNSMTLLDPL